MLLTCLNRLWVVFNPHPCQIAALLPIYLAPGGVACCAGSSGQVRFVPQDDADVPAVGAPYSRLAAAATTEADAVPQSCAASRA